MSDIADKIKKMLALAKSDNPAEAALAAGKAAELALKHGIDIDKLNAKPSMVEKGITFSKEWETLIAANVARLHGVAVMTDGNHILFIGRDDPSHVAAQVHYYLVNAVKAMNKLAVSSRGLQRHERAQFRKNFRHAASYEIARRLRQRLKELTTDNAQAQKTTGSTALVVQNHLKTSEDEAREFMRRLYPDLEPRNKTLPAISLDGLGAREGHDAGKRISINPATGASAPRRQVENS